METVNLVGASKCRCTNFVAGLCNNFFLDPSNLSRN